MDTRVAFYSVYRKIHGNREVETFRSEQFRTHISLWIQVSLFINVFLNDWDYLKVLRINIYGEAIEKTYFKGKIHKSIFF